VVLSAKSGVFQDSAKMASTRFLAPWRVDRVHSHQLLRELDRVNSSGHYGKLGGWGWLIASLQNDSLRHRRGKFSAGLLDELK
jgi:hypothetical protein